MDPHRELRSEAKTSHVLFDAANKKKANFWISQAGQISTMPLRSVKSRQLKYIDRIAFYILVIQCDVQSYQM